MGIQEIIVALFVVAAILYFVRRVYRTSRGRSACGSCGGGCASKTPGCHCNGKSNHHSS